MKDETWKHPGYYIRVLMETLELSQAQLARGLGITPGFLSHVLLGRRSCSAILALRLEKFFDVHAHIWLQYQVNWDLQLLRKDASVKQLLTSIKRGI